MSSDSLRRTEITLRKMGYETLCPSHTRVLLAAIVVARPYGFVIIEDVAKQLGCQKSHVRNAFKVLVNMGFMKAVYPLQHRTTFAKYVLTCSLTYPTLPQPCLAT